MTPVGDCREIHVSMFHELPSAHCVLTGGRGDRVLRCKVTVTVSSFRQTEKSAQKPATVSTKIYTD